MDDTNNKLVAALKRLSFAAQTSGGVAGRDDELVSAIGQAEEALSSIKDQQAQPVEQKAHEKAVYGIAMVVAEAAYKAGCGHDRALPSDLLRSIVHDCIAAPVNQQAHGSMPVYQWKATPSFQWIDCDEELFDKYSGNSSVNTRILYAAPKAPASKPEVVVVGWLTQSCAMAQCDDPDTARLYGWKPLGVIGETAQEQGRDDE